MASTADRLPADESRARLLDELRRRLEVSEQLAATVRAALGRGDAGAIESATARLETLALEYRVLAEQYERARLEGDERDGGAHSERARAALESTVTRLARQSAITGGLLERLIATSRRLIECGGASGPAYLPSGRSAPCEAHGLRLRERA